MGSYDADTSRGKAQGLFGDLCVKNFNADSQEGAGLPIKVLWETIIGLVAWIMVSIAGVAGVTSLSNLGGLPATLIILCCSFTLVKWIKNPSLLNK